MPRDTINDLQAFLAVAREQSFTKAATKLGVSQSALSHTVRGLEAQLGLRLLTRTTRSVAPTPAGERVLSTMGPLLDELEAGMAALSEFREKPAGTIRITTGEHAAHTVLWPALEQLLGAYPDIKVELDINNGLTDIVAGRYDAGVRLGEQVAKDMVAVRIGPEARMAVVGAPSYLASRTCPATPEDLTGQDCVSLRMQSGGLLTWEFEKNNREVRVKVDGRIVVNSTLMALEAAVAGYGLAYLLEDRVQSCLADGRLVRVLADWCPPFSGYHLYYPSRRQPTPAFALLVDALRYRG